MLHVRLSDREPHWNPAGCILGSRSGAVESSGDCGGRDGLAHNNNSPSPTKLTHRKAKPCFTMRRTFDHRSGGN
jgi:hypothetical protein